MRRENGLRVTNFRPEKFNEQIHLVEVCQMRLAHCLFRSLNELERLQRMRRGETIPAPIVGAMEITNENVIRVARGRGGRFAPLQEKQVQPPSEKFEKTNPI